LFSVFDYLKRVVAEVFLFSIVAFNVLRVVRNNCTGPVLVLEIKIFVIVLGIEVFKVLVLFLVFVPQVLVLVIEVLVNVTLRSWVKRSKEAAESQSFVGQHEMLKTQC